MDASSTWRARLTKLALCTGAVAALAVFTGEARADNGLSTLVSGTVSGPVSGAVEQLPAPAAEPLAEVISTVAPTVDAAVPPVVDEVVADVTQLPGEVAGPAIPDLREQTDSRANESGAGTEPGPRPSSAPEAAAAPADVPAPIAAETAAAAAAGAFPKDVRASRPAPGLTSPAGNAPRPRPDVRVSHTPSSQVVSPVSRDLAPAAPVAGIPVAAARPAHAPQAPSWPLPSSNELPGFDALLPPLAAFALLLALPLGLFALTAPNALGAGLQPAVAALRSADVRFRLVRPG